MKMRKPKDKLNEFLIMRDYTRSIPQMTDLMMFSQASKKKNELVLNVLTSMTELAPITASREVMFITLMMLRTT